MYAIIISLNRLIKNIYSTNIFLNILPVILNLICLTLSIICTKRCDSVYVKNKKINRIGTVIFPFWSGIFNVIYFKRVINSSLKICNICGTVTQARYTVCRSCKSVNNFTPSDDRLPLILETYNKILPYAAGTIAAGAAAIITDIISIYI